MKGKAAWYWNRLKAMSLREVIWRIKQKHLQNRELQLFKGGSPVIAPLYPGIGDLVDKALKKLSSPEAFENFEKVRNEVFSSKLLREDISLLGGHHYRDFATDWHAGFNTPQRWPMEQSYILKYKQRDDIGDARMNWELNRHRQFQRVALAVFLSSRPNHGSAEKGCARNMANGLCPLRRLEFLLDDWVESNPFLWGISWTSPMEMALRSISWMTAARLLSGATPCSDQARETGLRIRKQLLTGVANMTEYLTQHASGFSSANNHLIVEMAAVAIAGLLFDKEQWSESALKILDRELFRQTTPDGVDKESSLHYHGFVFEAYLLVANEMHAVGRKVPLSWKERLAKMAQFIEASRVSKTRMCVFGDDDEARIIDLSSAAYFRYLMDFYKAVLPKRQFSSYNPMASTSYLSSPAEEEPQQQPQDTLSKDSSITFPEGGYSFFRRGNMFVGVDHAPLGFGSIAAHGHCDALSFQFFLNGLPVFVDSGTYLYHVDIERRNRLRSSMMHNTVTINGVDQSEMLGPFLFGKKCKTTLHSYGEFYVDAAAKGLSGVTHHRRIDLADNRLEIADSFDRPCSWIATFILAPDLKANIEGKRVDILNNKDKLLTLTTQEGVISTDDIEIALGYGRLAKTTALRIVGDSRKNFVTLHPNYGSQNSHNS